MTESIPDPATMDFMNPDLPVEQRVADLLKRLTPEEKASQMLHEAPAIDRLGIPAYNWWNECLHGVARAGTATVFPQAIGLGAMFNDVFLHEIAEIISDEARAKHHEYLREHFRGYYAGLTYWSPNINIFRDPRWGRGHETYGECPFLSGRLGVAFCIGLQGNDPKYLKLVATPKHYAVHSGPEPERHSFNATVSEKDLRETYLPAFRDCVIEAGAESIMGAYNRTNNEVCCGSPTLLQKILRDEWGFEGYVVSDCWAILDFHEHHKVTNSPEQSAAMAVTNGCDLNCGCIYEKIMGAMAKGLLTESDLDVCVARLFSARIRLGMFDPPERVPYADIPIEINDCPEHHAVALEASRQSLVLLKNADQLLPLAKDLKTVAVIGPNAADDEVLKGNYSGTPSQVVTPLEGIRRIVSPRTKILYAEGCKRTYMKRDSVPGFNHIEEAVSIARRADVAIMCLGLDTQIEGEQGDTGNSEAGGDKVHLNLTGLQQQMLEEVAATGTPVVLVVIAGSALALTWAQEHVGAIVQAWYPGQFGGQALAETLFGDYSPAGRLPVTFPMSLDDLPDFSDYAMAGRTYRYATAKPLYPFGFGLSYSQFDYDQPAVSQSEFTADDTVTVSVNVTNTGKIDADEVVQLYVRDVEASVTVPHHELRGFKRVRIAAGATEQVGFELDGRALSLIDNDGRRILEPGVFELYLGGQQPDTRSAELTGRKPVRTAVTVVGEPKELAY